MVALSLHRGGHRVSAAELDAVPVPARTDSWCPVPHHHLLDLVRGSLDAAGYRMTGEQHALAQAGQRYFGLLEVHHGHGDYGLVVGVRNSHDKTFPAGLCLGSRVFVCDNLAFSSEVVIARKHTSRIELDLPGLVMRAVGRLTEARGLQDDRIAAYKAAAVSDPAAHDLLVRAVDTGALPVRRLTETLQEWRTPSHEAFAPRTGWRLFNAVTEALKGMDLQALPRRTQTLHGLMDGLCGFGGGRKFMPCTAAAMAA